MDTSNINNNNDIKTKFQNRSKRAEFFKRLWYGCTSIIFELFSDYLEALENYFPDIIRPPGAINESDFLEVCIRCGACQRACKYFAIKPVLNPNSIYDKTPQIITAENWCRLCDEFPCAKVCPSGALQANNLHNKQKIRLGLAKVNSSLCLRKFKIQCFACINACPLEPKAISLKPEDCNSIPQIDITRCTGCGACSTFCPVTPEKAIVIIRQI